MGVAVRTVALSVTGKPRRIGTPVSNPRIWPSVFDSDVPTLGNFDLFHFYRFVVVVVVTVYCLVRIASFVWWWCGFGRGASRVESLVRRYLHVLLLRLRWRRFLYELTVIGGLCVTLVLLLRLHWE